MCPGPRRILIPGYGYVLKPTSLWFPVSFVLTLVLQFVAAFFSTVLATLSPCTSLYRVQYLLMAVCYLGAAHRLYEYGISVIEIRLANMGVE